MADRVLITAAESFARLAHKGQFRQHGSNDSYVEHPRRVAEAAAKRHDATPEMVAAAWLHDVLEDTDFELDKQVFGVTVPQWVRWLTNRFTAADYPELNRRQRKRLEALRLSFAPREVKIIKMLDRLDNLRDLPNPDGDFVEVYLTESLELYHQIGDADRGLANNVARLCVQMRLKLREKKEVE